MSNSTEQPSLDSSATTRSSACEGLSDADYDVRGSVDVAHDRLPLAPSLAGTDVSVRADLGSLCGPFVVEVTGDDCDAFEADLATDPTVQTARLVTTGPTDRTYVVEIDEARVARLFPALMRSEIHLLDVRADRFGWHVGFETTDRTAVRSLADGVEDDASFDIRRLGPSATVRTDDGPSLTPRQREVLRTALEGGYFAVPRGCSQTDLAGEFDVTPAAVSQQVRRAVRSLVESAGIADGVA